MVKCSTLPSGQGQVFALHLPPNLLFFKLDLYDGS